MSETKETKTVRRGVVIALGIICMILIVGLVGVIANYTLMISDRDNTIASLNSQVSQLNTNATNLQTQIDYLNSKITSLQNQVNKLTQILTTTQGFAHGLQLTMILEEKEYNLGEPINITFILTNISNQTKEFGLGPDVNDFDFHVYNDTNNDINDSYWYSSRWIGGFILMYVIEETLNPGESLNCSLVWQQTFGNTASSEGVPVSPGTYYIVGRIGRPFFIEKNSWMETTPIQITIV
jgi:uncharacterized coiled-coil protein SlyX